MVCEPHSFLAINPAQKRNEDKFPRGIEIITINNAYAENPSS
jgi:hypothetical protein